MMAMRKTQDMRELRCAFGGRVKEFRKAQHLTQEQLGRMVGLDRSHLSRIERGVCNASLDSLFLVAYGLGKTPAQLFEGVMTSSKPSWGMHPFSADFHVTEPPAAKIHVIDL